MCAPLIPVIKRVKKRKKTDAIPIPVVSSLSFSLLDENYRRISPEFSIENLIPSHRVSLPCYFSKLEKGKSIVGSGDGKVVTNTLTNIWPKLVLSRWSKSKSFEIRKNKQLGGGKKKGKRNRKKKMLGHTILSFKLLLKIFYVFLASFISIR